MEIYAKLAVNFARNNNPIVKSTMTMLKQYIIRLKKAHENWNF